MATMLVPMILVSCSDDIAGPDMPVAERLGFEFSASIEQDNTSRADESGFADGDRFGAFVVNYASGQPGALTLSDNQVNNVAIAYAAEANRWTPATDIYWRDPQTPADVYGYYPFNNGLGDVETYNFEVRPDQSLAGGDGDMGAYEASDFLWAKAARVTPGTKISLAFTHRLAGVKVILEKGDGFTGDEWEKLPRIVTVDNTLRTAAVDLSTGVATPTGSFDRNVVMNPEGADVYRAVVVPQTVAAGKTTIGLTIDGYNYAYTREGGMIYTAGKLHSFKIRIDKKRPSEGYSLTLVNEEITPWEADNSSHDFEANSYLVIDVPVAGTLKDCLAKAGADYQTVRNLKITGQLTDEDFRFMREDMSQLTAINLKEARMVNVEMYIPRDDGLSDLVYKDDVIPSSAFQGSYERESPLRRIILPENITEIGSGAFSLLKLTGTLIIPNSVKKIWNHAFDSMDAGFDLVMPDSLEYIGMCAFDNCQARFELKLSPQLKYIGYRAFAQAFYVYGTMSLPVGLTYLGADAFGGSGIYGEGFDGDIVIPEKITHAGGFGGAKFKKGTNLRFHDGVTEIVASGFSGLKFNSPITFPDKLLSIDDYAFSECQFVGTTELPDNIQYIGNCAFYMSNFLGEITCPSEMDYVTGGPMSQCYLYCYGAFNGSKIKKCVMGDNIQVIGAGAFHGCDELRYVEIGKNVTAIGYRAFGGTMSLSTIVCLAKEPPKLYDYVFTEGGMNDLDTDHCVLEVPEESIDLYKNTAGWNIFKNITPHRELACSLPDVKCLNKGITRTAIVRSEGAWEVSECPSWIHVSPSSADHKEEITVKVDPLSNGAGNREGKIVFRLKGKDYTTYVPVTQYDFSQPEDTEIILQSASSQGDAIPVFIVGEGFGAESIALGDYMERMRSTMEDFFAIEPYKSYRSQFEVSCAVACSPEDGTDYTAANKQNCFNTVAGVELNVSRVKDYVAKVSSNINQSNIGKALIIVVSNYKAFTGWSSIDSDGCSLACVGITDGSYPYDQRGLVQHFAGGEAFAGLGDESVSHFEHIKGCTCPFCNALEKYNKMKNRGYYENLTMNSKMADAPWYEFIFNPKYSSIVDMWEGGYNHLRGVWRSEVNSVMNSYIPYYNTMSRYVIYKQIMRRTGRKAFLEEFIANDKIEIPQ